MSDTSPTFRGTKPTVENICASCGADSTAGCWRRGWKDSSNNAVNLCNRCGLQFKNGKLDSSVSAEPVRSIKVEDALQSNTPPAPSSEPQMIKESSIVSYSMIREADTGGSKRVLFYIHDKAGASKLAITGVDSRGTGHFVYESEEGFSPALKCTNRTTVTSWLAHLGATYQTERAGDQTASKGVKKVNSKNTAKPKLDKEYVDYREDTGNDGTVFFENFYFVDSSGNEVLAVCGSIVNECCVYRCVLEGQETNFENKREALEWMDWIIGKADTPPYRFLRKDLKKSNKRRDSSPVFVPDHNTSKRRVTNLTLEDMRSIFRDPELIKWVLRKPNLEELETFKQWKKTLSGEDESPGDEEGQQNLVEAEKALRILQLLQKRETCLKLLEETSIGRPISLLTHHPNKQVAKLASEISVKWNEWTNQALAKATAARNA